MIFPFNAHGRARRWGLLSLASSALLLVSFCVLVAQMWYPAPYAQALHVRSLLAILIFADLMLAWFAPWVAFRGHKSVAQRWIDGLLIVGGRLAVFSYFVSEIVAARPVFVVHAVDRLDVVSAFEVVSPGSAWQGSLWHKPALMGLVMPGKLEAREKALMFELSGGNISAAPAYYGPYDHGAVMKRAQPLSALVGRYPARGPEIASLVKQTGYKLEDLRWIPMRTRFGFSTAIIAGDHPGVLAWLDMDPF